MTKRIFSLLLALALAIALLPVVSVFAAEYNLFICEVQVTDANKADILGDGVFSFDPATNTLTIAGDCTENLKNIVQNGYLDDGLGNLTIYVAKDSHFYGGESTPIYLRDVNATITGPGKLTVTADSEYTAIWLIGSSSKLTVKDADLKVDRSWWAIHGADSPAVEIINSNIYFLGTSTDELHAIGDLGALRLTGCTLTLPADGVVKSNGIFHADGTWAEEVKIVRGTTSTTAVTAFNVTVPDPAAGQKPATTATITTTPSGANVKVDSIEWFRWDESLYEWAGITDPAYVFEAGEIYGIDIEVSAGENTTFDPAVKGTLNGKPSDQQYGNVYVDRTHAYIGFDWGRLPTSGNYCDGGVNCPSYKFKDVNKSDWYHDAVDFAVTRGLFNGMSETAFEPNTPMSRAMLVTVLLRYEGQPEEGTNIFVDVPNGQWYTMAVTWAAANGIVNGIGQGRFDPNGRITREQLAAILYRYSLIKGYGVSTRGNLNYFPDAGSVSSWAVDAYSWAVGEGLISGNVINGKTMLDPQGSATRAQVATILMRFIIKFAS